MKKSLVLTLLIFTAQFVTFLGAQTNDWYLVSGIDKSEISKNDFILIDTTLKIYHKKNNHDTIKLSLLNHLIDNLEDEKICQRYCELIIRKCNENLGTASQQNNRAIFYLQSKAYALNTIGVFAVQNRDYKKANRYYLEGLNIHKKIQDTEGLLGIYVNLAFNYANQKKIDSSLYYYKQIISFNEKLSKKIKPSTNYINLVAYAYQNIATFQADYNQYEKAKINLLKALEYRKKGDNTQGLIQTQFNLATSYTGLKKYDSSNYFLWSNIKISEKERFKKGIYTAYTGLGTNYFSLKDFLKAEYYFNKALQSALEAKDSVFVTNIMEEYLRNALKKKSYDKGIKLIAPNIDWVSKLADTSTLNSIYRNLSLSYAKVGNYEKAYKYILLNKRMNDIAMESENTNLKKVYDLEEYITNLKNKEKIQENKLLKSAKENAELKLSQHNYYLFALTAIIIVLTATGFLIYRQSKINFQSKTIQLEHKLLRSQMNPHFLFNSLNAIHSVVLSGDVKIASKYLASFAKLIRSFLESSRNELITLEKEIGLLRNYIDLQILRFESNIKYNITIDENLNTTEILLPPMLLQPFIENAFEHGLNKITDGFLNIDFTLQNNFLIITVMDNGEGLGTKGNKNHTSLATTITTERLLLLNKGKTNKIQFTISDAYPEKENKGVKVVFQIPVV